MSYASFTKRFLSFLIDVFYLYCFARLIPGSADSINGWMLNAALISFIYFPLCLYIFNGQTLGAKLLNIRIVILDGRKFKFTDALARSVFLWIFVAPYNKYLFIGIALLIMSFGNYFKSSNRERKQMLWDYFPGTVVLNSK